MAKKSINTTVELILEKPVTKRQDMKYTFSLRKNKEKMEVVITQEDGTELVVLTVDSEGYIDSIFDDGYVTEIFD